MRISIHALREEGDAARLPRLAHSRYFYPRPPRGGRLIAKVLAGRCAIFLSTPSARRATGAAIHRDVIRLFLSTPSARRATGFYCTAVVLYAISIHALREEGDLAASGWKQADAISIHALREEGDVIDGNNAVSYEISIHALREEGDAERVVVPDRLKGFLSTPSARRATHLEIPLESAIIISIHALREEGDPCFSRLQKIGENFYPRPPRGGRLSSRPVVPSTCQFLSTPSARRATQCPRCCRGCTAISIHALREEGDAISAK